MARSIRVGAVARGMRPGWLVLACALLPLSGHGARQGEPGAQRDVGRRIAEVVYDGGLGPGWQDLGWAPRELKPSGPARLRLSGQGGWILYKPGLKGPFGGLTLRLAAPAGFDELLEVRLDSMAPEPFPRVRPAPRHRVQREAGWVELFIPFEELDPRAAPFDRIVLRASREVGAQWVALDKISLTAARVDPPAPRGRPVQMAIDCAARGHRISPFIYGIALDGVHELKDTHQWELGATARRWGGNPSSRYNWQLGNAWNVASDYFFRNVPIAGAPHYTYDDFLETNLSRKVLSALTVPMLGWVAKDTTSVAFPVSRFGEQQAVDPFDREAGNGFSRDGKRLEPGPPTLTSAEAPPGFIARWVQEIHARDASHGRRVGMYILDNEPMLWNSTHRDVHPRPVSYDELLSRTLAYGSAVRKADPEAVIAGPAEWGWSSYHYSALDLAPGTLGHPDRRAHGDVPLLIWYLRKLREHEQRTGERILDVVDVHFYPQGDGIVGGGHGRTDPDTAARRIRSTRGLWDPTYRDESWIDDELQLLPRLKRWIAESYPGRGISIGEYNFGAPQHMSGGLAQAEALGRFAEAGLYAAFYWQYPPRGSPAFWAFRAYRDFDGHGGHFLDVYAPSTAGEGTSLFASRDEAGTHLVAVALNLDPDRAADARLALNGCGRIASARTFTYAGAPSGFTTGAADPADGGSLGQLLPPYSITVFDVLLHP